MCIYRCVIFITGNVYILFYDNPSNKELYMDPVVVDFTNAPTIISNYLIKYDETTTDNVFNTKWKPADGARIDVLTGSTTTSSEYYNEYKDNNRLYTNGIGSRNTGRTTFKNGHPVYVNWLMTFVPKEISDLYAASTTSPIGFQMTTAYLTTDNTTTAHQLPLEFAEKPEGTDKDTKANKNYVISAVKNASDSTVTGNAQEFVISLSNYKCQDATDKDFREHCKFGYELELSGVSNDWK